MIASAATAGTSGRITLGFDATARANRFTLNMALSSLTGLADGLAPKSWRYAAIRPRFAPNNWVPRHPRYVGGCSAGRGRLAPREGRISDTTRAAGPLIYPRALEWLRGTAIDSGPPSSE